MQTPTQLSRRERAEIAERIYAHFESIMVNLYSRWQSEKGFESFDGYIKVIRDEMVKSFPNQEFFWMAYIPSFAFVVKIGHVAYEFSISDDFVYSWKKLGTD